jgi:hypothetical protein
MNFDDCVLPYSQLLHLKFGYLSQSSRLVLFQHKKPPDQVDFDPDPSQFPVQLAKSLINSLRNVLLLFRLDLRHPLLASNLAFLTRSILPIPNGYEPFDASTSSSPSRVMSLTILIPLQLASGSKKKSLPFPILPTYSSLSPTPPTSCSRPLRYPPPS